MAGIPDVDLFQIPLIALRTSTREIISTLLNPMKVIPNSEGLPRDWRGLAQLTGMNNQMVILIGSKPDPTAQVLSQWRQGSIGLLKSYLGQLDRWDVVDDTENEMVNNDDDDDDDDDVYDNTIQSMDIFVIFVELDASHFLKRKNETKASAAELDAEIDKQILTIADVYQLEQGFEPQHYDAFLLYAEEDQDFAMQIVDKMERDYGLTDNFVIHPLSCLDQRLRKVVPVMYQRCQLPSELTYYFWLDYSRSGKLYDFWTKLHNSILSTTSAQPVKTQVPAIKANGEESISYKVQPALEQNKITSPNCVDERDESSADTCSLNTELLSIQSGRVSFHILFYSIASKVIIL
ncbi:hypothetical protein ANN_23574 [Periplaneta americana]|uniref:TIR domain-containing protein n=1 Tax=Periplaneta americana TaxID=6978 RepID=A0ABQ8SMT4_PERAM|nr:hypothetical protein ANN_23574 [Periplaneta americana]